MQPTLKSRILSRAAELGLDAVGISSTAPAAHAAFLDEWLERGFGGEMNYMARNPARRKDPSVLMPEARSIIVVALNYYTGDPAGNGGVGEWRNGGRGEEQRTANVQHSTFNIQRSTDASDIPTGVVARYAWGDDYHEVLWEKLEALAAFIRELSPSATTKVYADTGPLLERELAQQAGAGFVGKSTILINRSLGTWFFLGEILTSLELEPDAPQKNLCGTCERCIEVCPTQAIVAPFQLDSRRCISYLTIELKGAMPRELRPLVGTRIYGCDDCLEVCPWNRFAKRSREAAFQAKSIEVGNGKSEIPHGRDPENGTNPKSESSNHRFTLQAPDLLALLAMSEEDFRHAFKNSPIKRIKRRGLLRNVCVALGNLGDERAVPALIGALEDAEPLVRGHAAWALGRLRGESAKAALHRMLETEHEPFVIEELTQALTEMKRDSKILPGRSVNANV